MQTRAGTGSDLGEQDTCCSGSVEKDSPSSNMQDHISGTNVQTIRPRFGMVLELGEQDTGPGEKEGHPSNAQDHISRATCKRLELDSVQNLANKTLLVQIQDREGALRPMCRIMPIAQTHKSHQ